MTPRPTGFSLTELLVALAVTSLAMVSVIGFHVGHKLRSASEDLNIEVQQNLRLAMEKVQSSLRNSNYGVPAANVSQWINWVGGFSSNPVVTAGPPGSVSVASCGLQPLTTLASTATAGATMMTLTSAAGLDNSNRRLIYIDDAENAIVKSVSGNTITVDTDPTSGGNQGIAHTYPAGTPVCRVDVTTYSLNSTKKTLQVDSNQGGTAQNLADGITAMSIVVDNAGAQPEYTITLTGQSSKKDPTTSAIITMALSGTATPLQ